MSALDRPDAIEAEALELMDAAAALTIKLSENEEDYDLPYLAAQLAKCSSYGERLADMLARLTQVKIEVLREVDRATNALEIAEAEAEVRAAPGEIRPASRRTAAIRLAVREEVDAKRAWKGVDATLREVREDVSRRAEMIRRLDSDLRLHQKIIEAKITAGAMGFGSLLGDPRHKGAPQDVTRAELETASSGDVDLT
jgi:hypothetical protein